METYETNPDFARVSFLRNTKSAALGVSGFEKRSIRVPRAVSPAIRLDISFPSSGMWGVTGETGRRREQAKYQYLYVTAINLHAKFTSDANFHCRASSPLIEASFLHKPLRITYFEERI
jgi:hypothetical protein